MLLNCLEVKRQLLAEAMLTAFSIPLPLTLECARLGARPLMPLSAAGMPVSHMLGSDGPGTPVPLSEKYCTGLVSYGFLLWFGYLSLTPESSALETPRYNVDPPLF